MTSSPPSHTGGRPLSPHLRIYRFQITSVMSILHRITGAALAFGTIFLVLWLWAAAYSPPCFADIHSFFSGFLGRFMLFGWTVAFYYHFLNGVRHLCWDMGKGFDIPSVERSGWTVVAGCIALTVISWIIAFTTGGTPS